MTLWKMQLSASPSKTTHRRRVGSSSWLVPASGGMVSRCVVLRCKLNETSVGFTDYVIAHQFSANFCVMGVGRDQRH